MVDVNRLSALPAELPVPANFATAVDGRAYWGTARQLWIASGSIVLRDLLAKLSVEHTELASHPFQWDAVVLNALIAECAVAGVEAPSSFPRGTLSAEWLCCALWSAYRDHSSAVAWQDIRLAPESVMPPLERVLDAAVGTARYVDSPGDGVPLRQADGSVVDHWGDYWSNGHGQSGGDGGGGGGGASGGGSQGQSSGNRPVSESGTGSGWKWALGAAAVALLLGRRRGRA